MQIPHVIQCPSVDVEGVVSMSDDLTGKTQKQLLWIVETGREYDPTAMIIALDSASGADELSLADRLMREVILAQLKNEQAYSILLNFVDERGEGPFTVRDIVEWSIKSSGTYWDEYPKIRTEEMRDAYDGFLRDIVARLKEMGLVYEIAGERYAIAEHVGRPIH